MESCILCGECVERCHYNALTLVLEKPDPDQPAEKQIHFDATLCRGCGLCAGTCSAAAISMKELEPAVPSLVSEVLAD